MTGSRTFAAAVSLTVALIVMMAAGASPALAENHPWLSSFGSLEDPNGIAIDESSGIVYVAAIGTDTVYKFDAEGKPVEFAALHSNALTGGATPAGSFAFPDEPGNPAAIAVDNSGSSSDPSRGDLYVMDAGHGVIDKYSPTGDYLSQITGFEPTGGAFVHELFGLALDARGDVQADLSTGPEGPRKRAQVEVDVFDDSAANRLIARQFNTHAESPGEGLPGEGDGRGYGFAVGPTGDRYALYSLCSCVAKFGQQLAELGRVDGGESGQDTAVALATDPATGHVLLDDQSSIAEWDGAAINGSLGVPNSFEREGSGTLLEEGTFGFLQLEPSSGQGGIAVDGATGEIYVSNPAQGNIAIFGSESPAPTAGAAGDVTQHSATLHGTVDPRGAAVSSCRFEYGVAPEFGPGGTYDHSVPCTPDAGGLGAGNEPVAVSAAIEGLDPGQLYHFRLAATGTGGSSKSSGLLATVGVGFGTKSFQVVFLNKDGSPDTQAGSHPDRLVNTIEFNSHFAALEPNADSLYVQESDGSVKDLKVDLPPGVVGDPNATTKKCTLTELDEGSGAGDCPAESKLGILQLGWSSHLPIYGFENYEKHVFNMVPPHGVALQMSGNFVNPNLFIDSRVVAGGDYPIEAAIVNAPPAAPVLRSKLTVFGDPAEREAEEEKQSLFTPKAFLTLPTGCHGPLRSTISMDSWQNPGHFVSAEYVTRNSSGVPIGLTGCSKLQFPPTISVRPDTTDASTSSGLTVGVHVPQAAAMNPHGLAESTLRDTTVTLPEGVALNPSGGDGLEACSEGLAGFTGFSEFNNEFEPGVQTATFTPTALEALSPGVSFCPDGSKIGTVKLKTPLLEHELEGSVYLATQNANPFGSLVAMYLMVEDPVSGSTVKLTGEVHLTATGQIITTFKNTPDLPFEDLELHFFGGERAPLTTPSHCGTYTTTAVFTPWDGNGAVTSTAPFTIDHGPHGGPCPAAALPFSPSLTGGSTNINAGSFSPLTTTISREDGQQDMQSVQLHMPAGLEGLLSNVKLCPEGQANEGTCGPESLIGETTVAAGVGSDPVSVKGGRVYLTEKYAGAPFGLSIVNPVKAGPFDLEHDTSNPAQQPACDCVVVRAKIEVNPLTAELTITTDPSGPHAIPHLIDGIPVQIKAVNVTVNRERFTFNPTSCSPMGITGGIAGDEGGSSPVSVPFQATNCAVLAFKPKFSVSVTGRTSKTQGAGLTARVAYPPGSMGSQANIARVKVELPKQLPSRLTTLQKACLAKVFEADPATCPPQSVVGHAKVITPVLPVPLEGPAYFVSHGGEQFPDLTILLHGYGVTIELVGTTFISKSGITSTTFKATPDVPFNTFELTLPQGPYSALAANVNLCASGTKLVRKRVTVHRHGRTTHVLRKVKVHVPAALVMPTEFKAQNGSQLHQSTPIAVSGCPKAKGARKASRARKRKTHR